MFRGLTKKIELRPFLTSFPSNYFLMDIIIILTFEKHINLNLKVASRS